MTATVVGLAQILVRPVATIADFYSAVLSGQPSGSFVSVNSLEPGLSSETFHAEISFQDESEFDFFKQFAARTGDTPAELRLVHLRNAVVFPRLGIVITEDNDLIDVTCTGYLSENLSDLGKLNAIPGLQFNNGRINIDSELFNRATIVSSPSIYAMHFADRVFGHWVFDVLPPLASQADHLIKNGIKILSPELFDWQRETLETIGLADYLVETGHATVRVEDLILSSFVDLSNTRRASKLSLRYFDIRT